MYRLINYLFGLNLICLFILEGKIGDHALIFTGLVLSILAAYLAFLLNWISLDATKAVIILGTIVLGFGGWAFAASVIFFFGVSSFLTRQHEFDSPQGKNKPARISLKKRRDGYQVWANGFWVAIFCTFWFAFGSVASFVAAFAVIATATADTWATEIGMLKPDTTWKITTFEPVKPGMDGGVSVKGTLAGVVGAMIIALFIFFTGILSPFRFFWVIFFAGVAGFLVDSVIGALFLDNDIEISAPDDFSSSSNSFTNNFINWTSTGISGLLAYLITQLLLL